MSSVSGYSRGQIILHWAIVVLLIVNYVTSEAMEEAWRAFLKGGEAVTFGTAVHVWIGVLVLVLAVARLLLRKTRGAPGLPPGGHPIADLVARLTHLGLYACIFLLPIVGMVGWFGAVRDAGMIHGLLFNILMALTVLHVAGALYHQYVLKDGLIRRMMRAE